MKKMELWRYNPDWLLSQWMKGFLFFFSYDFVAERI
ncbi:hypothetical protein HNR53_001913 [Bacillus benzoevorans]|uniref:Uncharacterized protein n=1 Tax=Bacillus benzoevorans TaxID=1456 RepID=A0A7X0HT64_9BACI|nr:hypothetical protein [Bacillus benzoevorans]